VIQTFFLWRAITGKFKGMVFPVVIFMAYFAVVIDYYHRKGMRLRPA